METIETHVFQDGEYVATRLSAAEIIRRARKEKTEQMVVPKHPVPPAIGLLSTTLVSSPVVDRIIPARIRGSAFNDLLFIGEDFIHVVEIQLDGHLQYVGTKSDFGSRIRAAAIVGKRLEEHDDYPPFLKSESSSASEEHALLPPQMLVVSLASGELQFLFASYSRDRDSLRFFQSRIQLPLGRVPLLQTGRHLVVEPLSRAIAVGSTGGTIVVHKLKPHDQLEQEFGSQNSSWNPVEDDLTIDTRAIVLQMAFLSPPPSDKHHAMLAAVVNDQVGVCRIRCYEIDLTESLRDVSPIFDYRLEDGMITSCHSKLLTNNPRISSHDAPHPNFIFSQFSCRERQQNYVLERRLDRLADSDNGILSRCRISRRRFKASRSKESGQFLEGSYLHCLDSCREASLAVEGKEE